MTNHTHTTLIIWIIDIIVAILLGASVIWVVIFLTERVGRSLRRAATIETLSQIVPRVSISRAMFERIQTHMKAKQNLPTIDWEALRDPFASR